MNRTSRSKERRTRGQALAEMGLVVVLLVTMLMGIIEFGRMLMVTNMVVHAIRDGARIAAVTPGLPPYVDAEQHVTDLLTQIGINNLNVSSSAASDPGTGINTVTVTVQGTIAYIFGFFADDLSINRSVTFRHEA